LSTKKTDESVTDGSVELPVKRTTGETLKDRMTDNAYERILPARYLRQDENGEIVESQEELFERVAKNVALAEVVYAAENEGEAVLVEPSDVKPDHSNREELLKEVFGEGVSLEDDVKTELTEENVSKFAYDTVVPKLDGAVREAVEKRRNEFQEAMGRLSFIPNCVPPDSLVAAGGGLKQISEVEPNERVYDDKDGYATAREKYQNGDKRVVEMETESGYSVRATPEHYFRVIDGDGEYEWRQVKDIERGEVLALQKDFLDDEAPPVTLDTAQLSADGGTVAVPKGRSRGNFSPPTQVTPEFAEWLGLYFGDGTARESGVRVAFDGADEDLLERWVGLTESVFGFEPTTGEREDADCLIGRASRRDLHDFLERNDLLKESSSKASVPDAVLRSGESCVACFLRGLFDADGTVGERQIELYTHSEELASQVQKLLLGLGIRSRMKEKRDGYRVSVRKNVCGTRFVERVGFGSQRKSELADRFTDVASNATSIEIPNQTERLRKWFEESELGIDAYRDLSQFLIDPDSDHHQEIGKGIFERYAREYPELRDSPVAEHVERNQFYETVTSVTEIGCVPVEDMKVPRRNTYVVEGFVSHNSPTLMNAGDELQQLSACFVDSPGDDMQDIHETAKEAAEVFQCLTDDARVRVKGKGFVSVSDVEPGDSIVQRAHEGDGHETRKVEETHAYDDAPVHRLVTEAGVEITGTPNHELLVDGDWTRIDETEPGDSLALRLGWLDESDAEVELETVENGVLWGENRTVSNDDIAELHSEGLSDYEIAEVLGTSSSTVQRLRSIELGLDPNGSGGREGGNVSFDADELESLHTDCHTDTEIADELGVSTRAVVRYRERHSLSSNGRAVKNEAVTQPKTLTPQLAELVGLWVGDGSVHEDGVRFHLAREETLEHADRLCRELFDEGLVRRWEDGCYDAVLHSHEVKRWWLANFGDAKPEATEACVPEPVRRADTETVAAFLRGLFTADGSLGKNPYPRLWSSSEDLVDGVQNLLLGLGVPAARWEYDTDERDYYNVSPTGETGLERFAELVGFVDSRSERMRDEFKSVESEGPSVGSIEGSTWHVPVECVEDAGTDTVYDVTVAEEPEYVANSVVSHNSGGGMGYAFWKLRPYGDPVGSTGGIASGPITFMRTFDQMCFVPGTKILTPGGNVPIEELEEGDVVVDENGDHQPVTATMERQVDEEIVEITPERLNEPLRVTREHPFKVARDEDFEWVDAGDLREDDRLVLGNADYENDLTLDETVSVPEVASGALVFTDGGVRVNSEYYAAPKGRTPAAFADEVPVSDFATLAGWYLAEGCVVYRRGVPNEVIFTLNSDEDEAVEEILCALGSFGIEGRVERVDDRNTVHVHAENASFAEFVEGVFGTGAAEKAVPDFLWNAPVETQVRVLEALFDGDGRLEKRGKSQRAKLNLTNEEIVDFAFQVGLRAGVQFSRHSREPEGKKPTYSVSASISTALGTPLERLFDEVPDDFRARDRTKQAHGREVVRVSSVETVEYDGSVHNAEVAETHTYVAEDIVVHNCETIAQGGTRRGAQMGVMRVSHPDVIQFIHAKNKDVSLAHTLRLNDPDDYTHTSFTEALDEARELIDDEGRVPEHLRNAAEGHLSNFNISVGVSHEFMEALENGDDFTFTNPRTGEPHIATQETKELYDRFDLGEYVEVGEELSVPAEEIWTRMIEGAYENGEPGVIYLDRVNDEHSFDIDEHPDHEILATNPCVTGDTLISTENGLVPAEELYKSGVATDVIVDGRLSDAKVKEASSVYKTGEKDVYRLTTEEGYEIRLTADHRVMTDEGWKETRELDEGDTAHIQNRKGEFGSHGTPAEGRVLGWLVGDGHLKHGDERADLNFYDEDAKISERFAEDVNEVVRAPTGNADYEVGVSEIARGDDYRGEGALEQRIRSERLYELAEEAGLAEDKHAVPDAVMRGSEEMARGFLSALFTADGGVQGNVEKGVSVRLTNTDTELLRDVQRLLLNFGVFSKIYEERHEAGPKELPDGNGDTKEYKTQSDHDLVISKDSLLRFRDEIGFLLEEKNEALDSRLAEYDRGPYADSFAATVESVEHDGHEAVYDLTEPDTHSFVGNGIVVHNCGEQPLEEYEACNLGHINLSTLVARDSPDWRDWYAAHADEHATLEDAVDAFLDDALDWEEFDRRTEVGTRFLENVVTMSDFPIDEIEEKVAEMRKIGLGIMGLAQMYVQTGIRYGSEEANEVARQMMRHINHESKRTSHELARERGVFDEWGKSKYANPTEYRDWFEKQTGESADDWEDGYPVRNHNSTTIAPTGCVDEESLVSTDQGIVPIEELDDTTAEFDQWDEIDVGVSTDGGTKTATAVYDNSLDSVRTIETETGFNISATPNHRFRVLTEDNEYEWRETQNIEPGDSVVLSRDSYIDPEIPGQLDVPERENVHHRSDQNLVLPEEMSPELAMLLGFYVGDGHLNSTNGVELAVDSEYPETVKRLIGAGERVFGVSATTEEKSNCTLVSIGGKHATRFFKDNGWQKRSRTAFVPKQVLNADEETLKAFLRGLFEADGSASRKIELVTSSEKLSKQVQTVLLCFGIIFKREKKQPTESGYNSGDENPYFVLRGLNKANDKKFLNEIGFISKSTDIELTERSYQGDKYPQSVVEIIRETDGYYDNCERTLKNKINDAKRRDGITHNLLTKVEERTNEPIEIDGRKLSSLFVDTVESVSDDVAYTKDISVPSNNTYIANGFVTHNTTSMIGNTTGGCEPIYNVAYYKNVSDDVQGDEMLVEFDDYFLRVLEANDVDIEAVKQEAKEQMSANGFDGVDGLDTVPDAIGELFVTTGDLSAKEHASVQCACQEGVDSAISKCLEEGTLVQTDSGVRPIESFADETPEPGEFVDVEEDITVDGVPVESQYYAGEKDATRVRVDNGTEIVGATESHRVLTPEGWKVLGNLEEDDYVVGRHAESHGEGGEEIAFRGVGNVAADGGVKAASGPNGGSVHEKPVDIPSEMSPRLARFLGMYAADGCTVDSCYSVEISTSSELVRDEARELLEELFGREPHVDEDGRRGDQRDTVFNVGLNSKPVWEFVKGLCGSGAYEKEVPHEVLLGSPDEKIAFINGVTLDGYVTPQSLVVYGGMSENLADGVAELLRSFGVPKVYVGRKWVKESDAYAYQVHVTNEAHELVTPIEPHKRIERFEQRYRVYVPRDEVDKTECGSRTTEYYAARNFEYRDRNYMFDTTAERLGVEDAPPLYEVTDVEDAGTREMYDVELAGPHEYVVGGVVSHNTTNAPHDSTVEDAKEVFEFIYENGGKGVTYYRDGTRSKQVLTTRADNKESADDIDPVEEVREMIEEGEITVEELTEETGVEATNGAADGAEANTGTTAVDTEDVDTETGDAGMTGVDTETETETATTTAQRGDEFAPRPRPDTITGATQKVETGYGGLYVTINEDDEGMFEVFARIGKSGGYTASFTEAIARLTSLCLRSGIPPEQVVEQLEGIRSPKVTFDRGEQVHSVPDAMAKAMTRYMKGETRPQQARLPLTEEEAESGDEEDGKEKQAESDGGTATANTTSTDAQEPQTPTGGSDVQQIIDEGRNPECPECGSMLVYTEGCVKCNDCGFSEC